VKALSLSWTPLRPVGDRGMKRDAETARHGNAMTSGSHAIHFRNNRKAGEPNLATGSPSARPAAARSSSGFTLVEVILAIGIAIGILVVALYFYGQAADLRARLLQESDVISSLRLAFDRFAADLRAAYAQPQVGFTGDELSMRFVVAGLPSRGTFMPGAWNRPLASDSDLHSVAYGVARMLEGTNTIIAGLTRTDQPLLEAPPPVASPTNAAPATANSTGRLAAPGTEAAPNATAALWIDTVHFIRLAYWDGTGWADHWDAPSLPGAVEICLGVEPLPPGVDPLDYPYELFRRVIFLPGSRGNDEPDDLFATVGTRPRLPH
jgi:type II secretory pathway pseudopilin PulG